MSEHIYFTFSQSIMQHGDALRFAELSLHIIFSMYVSSQSFQKYRGSDVQNWHPLHAFATNSYSKTWAERRTIISCFKTFPISFIHVYVIVLERIFWHICLLTIVHGIRNDLHIFLQYRIWCVLPYGMKFILHSICLHLVILHFWKLL